MKIRSQKSLRAQFKKLRQSIGTQAEVARLMGYHLNSIQNLENGRTPIMARHILALKQVKKES